MWRSFIAISLKTKPKPSELSDWIDRERERERNAVLYVVHVNSCRASREFILVHVDDHCFMHIDLV